MTISMRMGARCFGAPILGFITERVNNSLYIILACGIIMGIGFIALLRDALNITTLFILFTVIGVCCACQILAIAFISTGVSKRFSGLATAGANMIIMLFGHLFHSSIGLVTSRHATGSLQDPIYGKHSFLGLASFLLP